AAPCVSSRGVVVFHAASLVLLIGGLKRASAQASASPQRYKTRAPKRRYGGPPPRLARVASDLSATGKPAARRAAPSSDRVNFASRFSGTIAFPFKSRRYAGSAMVDYFHMNQVRAKIQKSTNTILWIFSLP